MIMKWVRKVYKEVVYFTEYSDSKFQSHDIIKGLRSWKVSDTNYSLNRDLQSPGHGLVSICDLLGTGPQSKR